MKEYSEIEKKQLLEAFKRMLDDGDNFEVVETIEAPDIIIDANLDGHREFLKRTVHTITVRKIQYR